MPDLEILKKVPIFSNLTMEELMNIGSICEEQSYPEYHTIFEEESQNDELYILVHGMVDIKLKLVGKNQWMTLNKMNPGEVFGEFALINQAPRSASAVAVTNVTLYIITRKNFFKLMDDNPRIGYIVMKNFSALLVDRLRNTDEELRNHIIWELVEAGE